MAMVHGRPAALRDGSPKAVTGRHIAHQTPIMQLVLAFDV
jgi:hypothetical protein